ncbi:MAG TPA: hypothetical protein VJ851_04745 [Jatrophihabitans sp.]|nr:hypothetical protein [Jatrophihabitans sp.]
MDLIELPPPDGEGWHVPAGDGQYRAADTAVRRRTIGWIAAVLVLLLVGTVAVLNQHRTRQAASADRTIPNSSTGQSQTGQGPDSPPVVSCPQIRDEESHLGYTCVDNDLIQHDEDLNLGLRIDLSLEVEPDWVVSEGSGVPTSTLQQQPDTTVIGYLTNHGGMSGGSQPTSVDVQREVQRRTALAVQHAYGDNPTARTLDGRSRMLSGTQGYELLTEITINPAYRQANGLQVRTERLWVVGLPTVSGVSIFMMSIPDDRSDLWPKAEAVVGTVHLI